MESKEDMVNHPKHYTSHESGVECIELTRWMSGNLAAAFKYVFRAEQKGDPIENYSKSMWYIRDERRRLNEDSTISKSPSTLNEYNKSIYLYKLGMVCGAENDADRAIALQEIAFAAAGILPEMQLANAEIRLDKILTALEDKKDACE